MSGGKHKERPFRSLFPSSTSIKDFAYPQSHPMRSGDFILSLHDSIVNYHEDDTLSFNDGFEGYNSIPEYSSDEINCKAIALFDFTPENDNEVALKEGQMIWISYRHGQGWLVAEDPETGENGLVPEEYVEAIYETEDDIGEEDIPKPFLPGILQGYSNTETPKENESESDWVDTDYDDEDNNGDDHEANNEFDHQITAANSDRMNKLLSGVEGISLR
ncbi:uncharacterized protein PRCAT00001311001 [Priceomyces carsonii]|uniref:uncharacterized protein n=1 Tax=Priceomyces carsonii TaxID=28549 RepID=UPI002ED953B2|nr:unnamed protein product [Priceomyces carsonii]